jgi:hypothetical protein
VHDRTLDGDICADCEEEHRPIPGRLFRGALRRQPLVRLGAGLVLGLFLGWVATTPYARRAERRVDELRARADADRYRLLEEAIANSRRLDDEADGESSRAAVVSIVIWLAIGGAAVAGWYRLT